MAQQPLVSYIFHYLTKQKTVPVPSVADPVYGRNPDPSKYLGLQRSILKNDFNLGLRILGGKFQESFGLKFLVVQEKNRFPARIRIRIRQKSNVLLNYYEFQAKTFLEFPT